MEENKASQMAIGTAYLRGYHATHDNPKIFDDFLAYQFLTEEERLSIEKQLVMAAQITDPARAASFPDQEAALAWMIKSWTALPLAVSRARYTEDSLGEAVRQGVKQYVLLGAGMDTFVFRCPELVKQLQVFEVDHPATQDFKRRRLTELSWKLPAQLCFVPVDFTQESLAEALKRSPYNPQVLTFFSWLGVTYYLTRDEVFDTLKAVVNIVPAGSMFVFDYLDNDAFVPGKVAPRVLGMQQAAKYAGEPIKAGFDPSTLATDLAGLGLHLQENLSPSDIQERYFQGRADSQYAYEHAHYACAVVE